MRTNDLDSRLCAQTIKLRPVFLSGNEHCHDLPESSRERELIKNQASGAELSLLIQPAG